MGVPIIGQGKPAPAPPLRFARWWPAEATGRLGEIQLERVTDGEWDTFRLLKPADVEAGVTYLLIVNLDDRTAEIVSAAEGKARILEETTRAQLEGRRGWHLQL